MFHADQGGAIVQVLTMVLSIGNLGTGFFGAGMRAVQDREIEHPSAIQSRAGVGGAHAGRIFAYWRC